MKKRKEEVLELAWTRNEGGKFTRQDVEKSNDERVSTQLVDELIKEGYLDECDGALNLTTIGEKEARRIIRAHRLSERLFTDVLDMQMESTEKYACTFEHVLNDEAVDSICTLLGHPRQCPHGRPIPPGPCCEKALKEVAVLVVPLSTLKAGAEAKIAYIATKLHQRLDRLVSFGLVPGATIHIHQTMPSYVLKIGETEIALDTDVAKDIFVRPKQ